MELIFKPKRLLEHFKTDSLFQNSVYLMLSTVVQAALGFAFWVLCSRLFTAQEIGLASALISASTFVSYVSLLGFNSAFIRFLPTSKHRNDNLNTGFALVLLVALVVSIGYVLFLPLVSPTLAFVQSNLALAVVFILLSALSAVNLLTDSAFIAYRAAKYNLFIYSFQSLAKVLLPLGLVVLGGFGIFAASGLAAVIALILSLVVLVRKYGYVLRLRVSKNVIGQVWHFSTASYIAHLLNIIPTLALPMIVINELGAEVAGYFYLAFMLANLVYAVGYAVSQSLFAEGSYDEGGLGQLVRRAIKFEVALMVPASIGLAVLGPLVLQIFGKSYGAQASQTIVVLALSAPAVAAYVLGGVLLRLNKQTVALVATNVVYALTVCGLALWWGSQGVVWVALAWLVGNVVTVIMSFTIIAWSHRRRLRRAASEATVLEAVAEAERTLD